MTQYKARNTAKEESENERYQRFIQGQIKIAEKAAIKLGFDAVIEKPTDIVDQEHYLQQILGYISFNQLTDEYFRD